MSLQSWKVRTLFLPRWQTNATRRVRPEDGAGPVLAHVACLDSSDLPAPFFMADGRAKAGGGKAEGACAAVKRGGVGGSGMLAAWDDHAAALCAAAAKRSARNRTLFFRGGGTRSCWDGRSADVARDAAALDDVRPPCGRGALFRGALAGELKRDGLLDARKSDGGGGHVSMQDQDGYAYLLSVEGHCGFADRDKHVFWMGSTLFHQESFCEEYYVLAATPWVHYVPVAYDYHNLRAAVAWANAHPRDVATIAANARDFAATWLTSTGIVAYFRALLLEIANATRYDVAARLGDGSGFVPAAAYLKPDRGKPGTKGAKQKAEEEETIIV